MKPSSHLLFYVVLLVAFFTFLCVVQDVQNQCDIRRMTNPPSLHR